MRENLKTGLAKALRINMTDTERKLWQALRRKTLQGFRFRRQHPIGPYIADFACLEHKLVIEVDGGQHYNSPTDITRDAYLNRAGWTVRRYWNNAINENLEGVLTEILTYLEDCAPTPTLPRKQGREN